MHPETKVVLSMPGNASLTLCQFCLLITIANILDPDQARQIVGLDPGTKLFDTLIVFLKVYFEKANFEKNQQTTKNMQNYPACKELTHCMVGNFSCFFCRLLILFKINFLQKEFQEYHPNVKQFGP